MLRVQGCSYVASGQAQWTLTIQNGNNVYIAWSFGEAMWMPIMLILGIVGIILFIISPVIIIMKGKKDWAWILWGIMLWLIGIGLIIGWLWG
jgi:hypothetical protein